VRIKRLVGLLSIGGLAFSAFMPAAHAAGVAFDVVANTKAYAIFDPGATYGTFGLGSTNPNGPGSATCFKVALDLGANPWSSNASSGNVLAPGGTLAYANLSQDFNPVPACTINNTPIETLGKETDAAGVVTFSSLAQNVSVDRGILAGSATAYMVVHPAGAVVAAPVLDPSQTANIQNISATQTVVTIASNLPVISKAKLDTAVPSATCELQEATTTPGAGNWNGSGTWTQTYRVCQEVAGQNVVKGKKSTLTVTGAPGAVSLSMIQGNTQNPQLWSQTVGKCKVETDDIVNNVQVAHDLICKGDWGDALPLTIAVRVGSPLTGGAPYGNPAGLSDPQGITTPLPTLLSQGAIL